jgi:hypothetical protein
MAAVGYYVYLNYFAPRKIGNNSHQSNSSAKNNAKGEFVDYEEVE